LEKNLDVHMAYRVSVLEEFPDKEYEEMGVRKIVEEIEDREA
jgi:hypothetical protein